MGRRLTTPPIHRGEVWWAHVPGDKRRPVLVLTRERFIAGLHTVLVAPLTTRVRGIPTEVDLDKTDGVPRRSAVNFDNVFTLNKARFDRRVTKLTEERMQAACDAYTFATGC